MCVSHVFTSFREWKGGVYDYETLQKCSCSKLIYNAEKECTTYVEDEVCCHVVHISIHIAMIHLYNPVLLFLLLATPSDQTQSHRGDKHKEPQTGDSQYCTNSNGNDEDSASCSRPCREGWEGETTRRVGCDSECTMLVG